MNPPLRGISSMATRQLLAELASAWEARTDQAIAIESVGGVDAAKRVQAGEPFDLVFLASDALAKLEASGHVRAGTTNHLAASGVAIAVRAGAPVPDVSSEDALRAAVLAAPTIGYSTGPSGTALLKLFDRWGIAEQVQPKLVQAPAGVPVGSLVAKGEIALGFQQRSELMHLQGITIAGGMPAPVQITTIFSGAVGAASAQPGDALRALAWMASPEADAAKTRHGMQPA